MTVQLLILLAALVSASLSLFILNLFVSARLKGKVPINEAPIAADLLRAVIFLSAGLMLNDVAMFFQTVITILPSSYSGSELHLMEISYCSLLLAVTLTSCFIIIWTSSLMYSLIAKGKSIFIEVANNNLGSLILFSALLIVLTLAAKAGLSGVLDSFIPYPTLPIYH
jgi:hypothetical protein